MVDGLVVWLYLVGCKLLEKPADTHVHEALHAETQLREPAERLAAEVHADGRRLEGERKIVLGVAALVGEGEPRTCGQLGIQADMLPVQPRELHLRHRAHESERELPVGRLVPVAVHVHGLGRHIIAHDRPAEAQPVIDIVDVLHAHAADEMRILEREMPQREHRPEHAAQHIGRLRHGDLAVRDGELILVRVVLGKHRASDDKAQ